MINQIAEALQPGSVNPAIKRAQCKVAEAYKERLIHNMRTNKFKFKLAMSTIRSRLAAGKGDTPLVFTEAYINAIQVQGTKVFVKKGKHYSGLTFQELSFILEYGRRDRSIPSRPIWRLTWEEFQPEANRIMARELGNRYLKRSKP